jgi:O-antigen/teichoic acid export membrane protein
MSEQEHIYRFYRNPWGYNFITITKSITNIGAGVLLVVHYQLSVFGAQTASLISTIIIVVISIASFTRKKYYFQFSRVWAKKMIKYGFPLVWAGIAVWVYSVSDRFILLHFHDSTQIGYYSIGSTFAQPIGLISMAVQMSFGAIFYEVFHKELSKEKYQSRKLLRDVVTVYIIIASIAACYLSIFAYEIIGFITTPEYLPGIIIVPIISLALIFAQLSEVVPVGISISEKTWHFTWIIGVAASVNLILNFIFIPSYGYAGAAATTLAAYLVYFSLSDWVSRKYFDAGIPRLKIYVYLCLILGVALFFPFFETYYEMRLGIGTKMLSALLILSLPLLLRLITIDQIRALLKTITTQK